MADTTELSRRPPQAAVPDGKQGSDGGEALLESEARFRATFDQAAVGIAHVGLDNRTLWANRGLCAMFGYTEAEMRELTFLDLTHPDDLDLDRTLARQLIAGEIPWYRIEKRYLHKDGSVVWGDLAASLVRDAEGNPRYGVGVVVDITGRKRAEARLEAVLESINDHLVCYDRQWRYTFVNDRAAEVLGRPKEELLGRCIWELFPEAVGNQYYHELHQALAEMRVIRSEHYYPPFAKWFENHIYPSADGVTVFSADVTFRKTMEAELQQRARLLTETDRRKDEFLATLAHELRNPLAPISNGLETIRLAGSDPEVLERTRARMERQVRHLVRLVDDLLDVSRISRNRLELRRTEAELSEIVSSAVETSHPLIEAGGHELTLSLPRERILLNADAVRLSQAISNLLNNAAKYTERGGRIGLTAELRDGEVLIRVRDSGIGIAPEKLEEIFELFVQADRSVGRSQGGLGIGLTLVQRLVHMHGGSVEARSAGPGQGAEFTIRLPVGPVPAREPRSESGAAPAAARVRRRVLVVDDERDAADTLAALLQYQGHEVATAYDGLQALQLTSSFAPEILLMDLGMPNMDGLEAARRIRQLPGCEELVLVALTGWGQEEDRRRSREAGFDVHVSKPIDPAVLERLLAAPRAGTGRPEPPTAEP